MELRGKRKLCNLEDQENVENDVIFVAKVEPPEIKRNRLLKIIIGDHVQFSTRGAVQDLLTDPAYFECDRSLDGDSCKIVIPEHVNPWAAYVVLLAALNPGVPLDCKSTANGLTLERLHAAATFLKVNGNQIGLQPLRSVQKAEVPHIPKITRDVSEERLDSSFDDNPGSQVEIPIKEEEVEEDTEPEHTFLSRIPYIQSDFYGQSQRGELLPLSFDRMVRLLRKDYLNVPGEIDVYKAVISWCAHKPAIRTTRKKLDALLAEIRWDMLTNELIGLIGSAEGPLREVRASVQETLFPFGTRCTVERRYPQRSVKDSVYVFYADTNQVDMRHYVFDTKLAWAVNFPKDVQQWSRYKEMGPGVGDCLLIRATSGEKLKTWSYSMTTKQVRFLFEQHIQSGDVSPLAVLNGDIYAWDFTTKGAKNRSFKFNMQQSTCTYDVTRPKSFREKAAFATCDGKFYYCGGIDIKNGQDTVSTVEVYDAEKNKWTKLPDMQEPRRCFAVKVHEGCLYVVGGACNGGTGVVSSCERLKLAKPKDGWETVGSLTIPRYNHCLFVASGQLHVCGGRTSLPLSRAREGGVERYDQEHQCWEKANIELCGPVTSCVTLAPSSS